MPIPTAQARWWPKAMSDYQFALLMGFGVKAAIMASGVAAIFLGYKLFVRGIYKGGAGVKVEGWKAAVAMDKGGPGLVFALFGAIVLVVGITHPVHAEHDQRPGYDRVVTQGAEAAEVVVVAKEAEVTAAPVVHEGAAFARGDASGKAPGPREPAPFKPKVLPPAALAVHEQATLHPPPPMAGKTDAHQLPEPEVHDRVDFERPEPDVHDQVDFEPPEHLRE